MPPKKIQADYWGCVDPSKLKQGQWVWIPAEAVDKESDLIWMKGEVVTSGDKKITVTTEEGKIDIPRETRMFHCSAESAGETDSLTRLKDLSGLLHLHEPVVLQTLHFRFDVDQIYTFCGPILIVVNPFKTIPGIYSDKTLKDVVDAATDSSRQPPHIFTVAHRTQVSMNKNKVSQVCLISGESGAGKTESTKHVLKFLSGSMTTDKSAKKKEGEISTEQKVLNSNPVLEAFGNACTVRNSNSSRFGKFIEMKFAQKDGTQPFVGASIETYLLEKVRITGVADRERSFHIFYQCCAGKQAFGDSWNGLPLKHFGPSESFKFLARSGLHKLQRVDDAAEFEDFNKSMDNLGFSKEEKSMIVQLVCGVLHLGNVEIEGSADNSKVKANNKSSGVVAELLGIDEQVLGKALTHRRIDTVGESIEKPLGTKNAEDQRDSLARQLYGLLFLHVVQRVNESLVGENMHTAKLFTGVLDIFGFEAFKLNSFEQICINFTNERLQKMFNDFVFRLEIDLYKSEGIDYDLSDYPDNQDIIDLIQNKGGLFAMLDEECTLPKGSDTAYCSKVRKTFENHKRIHCDPRSQTNFTVLHFAGPVTYETANFMDKNMDALGNMLAEAMASSKLEYVTNLLTYQRKEEPAGGAAKGKKKVSLSSEFKKNLECLIVKMSSATPHFVRCIKPNPECRADLFHRPSTVEQLRYGGVIEALRVQRAGYPCREPNEVCWGNLRILLGLKEKKVMDGLPLKERLEKCLKHLETALPLPTTKGGKYAIGKTRVFFKQEAFEVIEGARLEKQAAAAIHVQKNWKMHHMYSVYKEIKANFLFLQNCMRRAMKLKKAREAGGLAPVKPKEPPKPPPPKKDEEEARRKAEEDARLKRELEEQKLKLEAELQRQKDEEEAARQAMEQKRIEAENKAKQLAAKLEALERDNEQLKNDFSSLEESSTAKLDAAAKKMQEDAAAAQNTIEKARKDNAKQIDEMRTNLDESHQKQMDAVKQREQEREVVSQKQIDQAKSSAKDWQSRFEEETQQMRENMAAQQKKWSENLRTAEGTGKTANLEKQLLEQQLQGEKSEVQRQIDLLKRQLEDQKRMYENQIETLEKRFQDREESFNKELEGLRTQRETLSSQFASQLERQRADLDRGREQELEFLKKRHEDELKQAGMMVDRVRLEQAEKEKTWEAQLGLKSQQQEDWERCQSNKTKHLEESSKRQREMHDAQVEQLSRQLREAQETFRRQLEEARAAAPQGDGRGRGRSSGVEGSKGSSRLNAMPKRMMRLSVARMSSALAGPGGKKASMAIGHRKSQAAGGDGPTKDFLQMSLSDRGQPRDGDVRVWRELSVDSAVTVVQFANATFDVHFEMVAVGCQSGMLNIFKIPKTRLERGEGLEHDDMGSDPELALRFKAHNKAITSLCFTNAGEELVTTSADWTVKVWTTKDGQVVNELLDSALVIYAVPIPAPARTLVVANANSVLRFVVGNNMVQKVRLDHYARSLAVGLDGQRVLAGTTKGWINAFSVGEEGLTLSSKMQMSKAAITCIVIIPCKDGSPPLVVANTMESQVVVLQANAALTNFTVLRRLTNTHQVLPLRSSHLSAPGRTGYAISGSEDLSVWVYDLDTFAEFKLDNAHKAPVMDVCATQGATLMASCDVKGQVVLWRRGASKTAMKK